MWRENANDLLDESEKRVRFLGGSRDDSASAHILVSEGEDDIDQEQDAIDNSQWALCDAKRLPVVWCEANNLPTNTVVPVLQDQNTRSDEQGASNHREEKVCESKGHETIRKLSTLSILTESLVNGSVHDVAGEKGNQDDGETNESSIDQHDRVLVIVFSHTVVVETQACKGDDLKADKIEWMLNAVLVNLFFCLFEISSFSFK